MPVDQIDQSAELSGDEQQTAAQAQEYQPGELAPAIITSAKVWKPDDIKKADATMIGTIQDLVNTVSVTDEAARRFSILQCWQERHFDRGYQYLEESGKGGWSIVGSDSGKNKNGLSQMDDANLYPTNIYSAQGDITTSALCRGQIKVSFTPNRQKNPQDVAYSAEANKYKHIWSENNNSIELQRQLMGLAWTDPRGVFWTRSMANKTKFGVTDDDEMVVKEVTTLHGVLETKGPMMADTLEQCGYWRIFEEMDYAVARTMYPWMGDKIKPSWATYGELEFERIARINTRIGIVGKYITGTSGIREATMGYMWFRPGMFRDDKINPTQREWLLTNFPEGLFVIMAGPEVVCCWNESMDDHLSLGMFTRGFGQNRRALGSSDIPIQKRINIWADLWDKFVRGAIAIGLLETKAFDAEAIAQLESSTTRFVEVALDEGQTMEMVVGQTPVPSPVQGFAEMFQWYVGPLIQSIDGATPALFGGGEGADNTVGATQIRLQQALERIGTAWIVANSMFPEAVSQAAKCCGENGNSEINDNIPGVGDISVKPANLRGNAKCRSETINAIPESGAQREAKVLQILDMAQQNQQIGALIASPSNAREIVKALHIDDVITIDEANSEDLALEDIEVLLDSEPLLNPDYQEIQTQLDALTQTHEGAKQLAPQVMQPGDPANEEVLQAGEQMEQQVQQLEQQLQQTPQFLPSVEVPQDDSVDHSTIAATAFAWMQEPDGRAIRRAAKKEQQGGKNWNKWTNVMLYWQGHKEMAAKMTQAQAPPPKISMTGKLTPEQQAALLQMAAGVQTDPSTFGQPEQQEMETIQRTPMAEIKTRTKRRL